MSYVAFKIENGKRMISQTFMFLPAAMIYQQTHPKETVLPIEEWMALNR